MHTAIFLDRDGVLIENRPNYVRSWDQVTIYPEALQALARIRRTNHKIILITNQSGIGRGLIPLPVAKEINQRLRREIEQAGGRIDGIFMCPHAPSDGCNCRKPKPGLLFEAAERLDIDLKGSIMIGDALTDLEAGRAAGIPDVALVLTGRGAAQAGLPKAAEMDPFLIYADLAAALEALVSPDLEKT